MAFLLEKASEVSITIPKIIKNESYVSYRIVCKMEELSWFVTRRYSEFLEMHEILVQRHGIPKEQLPPKKYIGNFSTDFLEKRRCELEQYLQKIFEFFKLAKPVEVMHFLGFERFEIVCHLRLLARNFATQDPAMDVGSYECDPVTLHAITERLCMVSPEVGDEDAAASDFANVLDYFNHLSALSVVGSDEALPSSNVIPNKYDFWLVFARSLEKLSFVNCNLDRVSQLGSCRETIKTLDVHNCEVVAVGQILLCDMVHKEPDEAVFLGGSPTYLRDCTWFELTELNARGNRLTRIDRSIRLAPKIKRIDLSCNRLESLDNLTGLPYLANLNLAFNCFSRLDSLHTKLGQITTLNLASNSISTLEGFQKLYSLVNLDLSCNKVMELEQMSHLGKLPCLENLTMVGNPVTLSVDYRTRSLFCFGDRAADVRLDGQETSEKELDTVAILRALEMAKNPGRGHPLLTNASVRM